MLFKNLIYSIQGRLVGPFSFWYFVHDDLMRTFRELGTKQITWKLIDLPAPTWATAKENLENTKTLICCHNRGARARAFVLLIDILVTQGVSYTGQIVLMLWLNSIYQIYDVKKLLLNFSHWQMFCVYCMLCVSYSRMCKLWWRPESGSGPGSVSSPVRRRGQKMVTHMSLPLFSILEPALIFIFLFLSL